MVKMRQLRLDGVRLVGGGASTIRLYFIMCSKKMKVNHDKEVVLLFTTAKVTILGESYKGLKHQHTEHNP